MNKRIFWTAVFALIPWLVYFALHNGYGLYVAITVASVGMGAWMWLAPWWQWE